MYRYVKIQKTPLMICALLIAVGVYSLCNIRSPDIYVAPASTSVENDLGVDVPIIMYHAVSSVESIQNDYVISPNEFESDLQYLQEQGFTTVFVEDLINYVNNGGYLPEKPVVLTFDDGYYNNYLYVFPLLQKYDCKATISPIAYYSELYTENGEINEAYTHCTWEQLKEMHESGLVELGNHTYNLHSVDGDRKGISRISGEDTDSYKTLIADDIQTAQNMIEENTGKLCDVFAYPFGLWSDGAPDVLKELNFSAVLTVESGINHLTRGDCDTLYNLKRLIRPHNSGLNI